MRKSILSIIAATLSLAAPAMAEDAEQGSQTGTPIAELFTLGDPEAIKYESFDIDARLQTLLAQACGTDDASEQADDAVTLDDCEFGFDFDKAVDKNREAQLLELHAAQTEFVEIRADIERVRLQTVLAEAIARRNASQERAGLVIDADAVREIVEALEAEHQERVRQLTFEADKYWEALTAAQEELTATQGELALIRFESADRWDELSATKQDLSLIRTEAAESCRRNEQAGVPLSVCDQPGHQAALEVKP